MGQAVRHRLEADGVSGPPDRPGRYGGARELAAELGCLPLALAQAAAVIAAQHLDYPAYLARLRATPVRSFNRDRLGSGWQTDWARCAGLRRVRGAPFRQIGDRGREAGTLDNLGVIRLAQGRYQEARTLPRAGATLGRTGQES